MDAAFVLTLSIAPVIEPVVSARNRMSTFGGIAGVTTVFSTVALPPEAIVAV
jgi:hypothetical protein